MAVTGKDRFLQIMESVEREGLDKLIQFFEKKGFFESPRYEGGDSGDLCAYSLKVYDRMMKFLADPEVKNEIPAEQVIVASLLHGTCFVSAFAETEAGWVSDDRNPLGTPGEKSVIMIQQFMRLKSQEMYAIRWQDPYAFRNLPLNSREMVERKYPLVRLLQAAKLEAELF